MRRIYADLNLGVDFNRINKSDLLRVDHKGNILDHGRVKVLNRAAFLIHGAIHAARPDVSKPMSRTVGLDLRHYVDSPWGIFKTYADPAPLQFLGDVCSSHSFRLWTSVLCLGKTTGPDFA